MTLSDRAAALAAMNHDALVLLALDWEMDAKRWRWSRNHRRIAAAWLIDNSVTGECLDALVDQSQTPWIPDADEVIP